MKTKAKSTKSLIKSLNKGLKDLTQMTYKDLKKAAVERGMEFNEVLASDFHKLNSFVHNNSHRKPDPSLLEKFDDQLEELLLARGQEQMAHPSLRLSYLGESSEEDKPREAKPKIVKKAKVVRSKNSDGIYGGTKKALTYELAKKGRSIERTIAKVKRKFPDAADKSIKIWYKKALKEA